MNPSRATIPLIRPHQCDSDGGRIRGVLLYYHKITEYGIKCCMHAHLEAPRAPPSRGKLYRCKTLFLNNFPIFFFYPNGTCTHPPTSKLFLDFWNFFNFAKPLSNVSAHQSCTIEVFRLEKKLQAYLVGLPEYCNTWKYSFETEKR